MGYLPEFTEETSFIEGMKRTNGAVGYRVYTKPATNGAEDRILPQQEREMPSLREQVLVKEDGATIAWERAIRAFLGNLPTQKTHRLSAPLVWEYATGMSVQDEWAKGNAGAYASDMRYINKILKAYFGKSRTTFINGRKFNRVYDVKRHFIVARKAPVSLTLYLEWKRGLLDGHRLDGEI